MKICSNIFISDKIKSAKKIIKKIKQGKITIGYNLIILTSDNRTEIINSFLFFQKYYKDLEYTLIGLTTSKEEAFEYIRKLVEISYKKYSVYNPQLCISELNEYDMDYLFDSKAGEF